FVDPDAVLMDHDAEIRVLVLVPMPVEALLREHGVADVVQHRTQLQIVVEPADQGFQRSRKVGEKRRTLVYVCVRDSLTKKGGQQYGLAAERRLDVAQELKQARYFAQQVVADPVVALREPTRIRLAIGRLEAIIIAIANLEL